MVVLHLDRLRKESRVTYDSYDDTMAHIERVQQLLVEGPIYDLRNRAQAHDASKLTEPEKPIFDEFSPRLRELEYDSPEYREALTAMGPALEHHYTANDHHPEHHGVTGFGIYQMSLLQLMEMLADWKAAGERHEHGGDLARSIEVNAKRFGYDGRMCALLMRTARDLGWV